MSINLYKDFIKERIPGIESFGLKDSFVQKNPECTVHFLVYHDDVDGIEKVADLANRINRKVTAFGITPLHLCAMVGSEKMAAKLLEKGADVNAQDNRKWTASHHAAVNEDYCLLSLFKSKGARPLLNVRNGTPTHILQMINPVIHQNIEAFFYQNEQGKVAEGTARQFKEFTGANLLNSQKRTAKEFVQDWIKNEKGSSVNYISAEDYRTFCVAPSKVFMRRNEKVGGWELVANQDIKEGEIVMEYYGETSKDRSALDIDSDDSDYEMATINAKTNRGLAGIANDSFPNVWVSSEINLNGHPQRPIFLALKNIKKGTVITYDYVIGHHVKRGVHVEAHPEEMENWFRKLYKTTTLFSELMKWAEQHNANPDQKETVENQRFLAHLIYLLGTPAGMVRLVCQKIVPANEIEKLSNINGLESMLGVSSHLKQWGSIQNFIVTLTKFEPKLKKLSSVKVKELIAATDTHTMSQLINLIKTIE